MSASFLVDPLLGQPAAERNRFGVGQATGRKEFASAIFQGSIQRAFSSPATGALSLSGGISIGIGVLISGESL